MSKGNIMPEAILKKNIAVIVVAILCCSAIFPQAVTFRYKYNTGDSYKILSTIDEAVYVNSQLDYNTQIVNRVTVKVGTVNTDGTAEHSAIFMTSENAQDNGRARPLTWGETYDSRYVCDPQGHYTITDEYFMPTVRDVPIFPDGPISPGDKWDAPGHEAHDLRAVFDIPTPFKVPFTAHYEYIGPVVENTGGIKKTLEEIHINYTMSFSPPSPHVGSKVEDYPVRYTGFSQQKVYWDKDKGIIDHYNEVFKIEMVTFRGRTLDFVGTARAETSDLKRTATKTNVDSVNKQVESLGLKDIDVKTSDKGLTISIENIKFKADSAVLENSEKEKLKKLAQILKGYPDNDLLVTGHTARGGKVQMQQQLSEERAEAVADYLMTLGVKDQNSIFTRGMGATVPIAPNDSEANMSKNRRVEITILDK